MSRLEELINELCPDGVEYKSLDDSAYITMGTSPNGDTVSSDPSNGIEFHQGKSYFGNVMLRHSNTHTTSPVKETQAGSIVMSVRAPVGDTNITDRRIAIGRGLCGICGKKGLETKFLYYFLNMCVFEIKKKSNGSTFESINSNDVKSIRIPLPPLPVQREIVRILDNFTKLIAELTAELTARKKQYEYYRELLLIIENNPLARWDTLGGISCYSINRINATELNERTYVGVDNLLSDKRGKTNSKYMPLEGNLTKFEEGDILIGNIRPYLKKIWLATNVGGTNGDVLVISINNKKVILPEYLYFILSSDNFFAYDMQNAKGAKMPRGDKNTIMKYSIPLPTIEEQARIVAILDRFDTLCNDLTIGLPAEIEARRKQYEYYRDKLLTFKEAKA